MTPINLVKENKLKQFLGKICEIGVDKFRPMVYYMQVGNSWPTWSSIEVVITGTTGNRVYPKRVPRVQIPPAPPENKSLSIRMGICFLLRQRRCLQKTGSGSRCVKGKGRSESDRPFGTPEGIRIPDLPLRRRTLYPAELLGRITQILYWNFRLVSTEKGEPRINWPGKICISSLHNYKFRI